MEALEMLSRLRPDSVPCQNLLQLRFAFLACLIDHDARHLPIGKFPPSYLATVEYDKAVVTRIGFDQGHALVEIQSGTFQNLHEIQSVESEQPGQTERIVPSAGFGQDILEIFFCQTGARGADIADRCN